jgi:hypothetical protein
MAYWIYENWVAENKAVVHVSHCGYCNDGAGRGKNIHGERNGRWTGPFATSDEAFDVAKATGRRARHHRCVGSAGETAEASDRPEPEAGGGRNVSAASATDLERYGFVLAGHWRLEPARKNGARAALDRLQHERVVYAFAVDSAVMYVGVCDSLKTTLSARMSRYENRVGAGTNARILDEIKARLTDGRVVAIYALQPAAPAGHFDLVIDAVRGVELSLIQRLDPPWNRRR